MEAKAHRSYRHEALLWSGLEDFLAATVPFVVDGLTAGQPVMVALPPERTEALRGALGAHVDNPGLRFMDMHTLGRNPSQIIATWREFATASAAQGRPARGIGEPIWVGRRPPEIIECQLHEALLNVAIEPDTPLWLLCPYDVDGLDPEVIQEAHRSHPALVEHGGYRGSTAYGGRHLAEVGFAAALSTAPDDPVSVPFGIDDLADVRDVVVELSRSAGLSENRAGDLALGIFELSANSVLHGGGTGVLRSWLEPGALVCEVTDAGVITDLLAGRSAPATDGEVGRGLWLVHHLCDLVQLRSGPTGTTVRVYTWLHA